MIQFDETTHTYTRNNTVYTPVTTLLTKYNLSADYSNIPTDVLQKAAQRGSSIHKKLEDYIKQGIVSNHNDVQNFIKYITARGIDLSKASSEEKVYDDNYLIAGTIDFQYVDNDQEIIADFKTTSQIHWEAVSWQLSIYNYIKCNGDILSYYMKQLKVFHMYNSKLTVRDVPIIDYDEVVKLLQANLVNAPYTYTPDFSKILSDSEYVVVSTLLDEIDQCEKLLNELYEKKDKLKDKIVNNMKASNQYTCLVQDIEIRYTPESTRKVLDKKKLETLCNNYSVDIDSLYTTSLTQSRLNFKRKYKNK